MRWATQPHVDAALALLVNARGELSAALPNKGRHREAAIALVDQAIVQVRRVSHLPPRIERRAAI
jgi:hypothetical protein